MNNLEDIYSLSPMQQGMLFHSLYAPESGVYVIQLYCTLQGNFDISAFRDAWQHVMERHPILRTSFIWERREKPLQVVSKSVAVPWEEWDWRGMSAAEQQEHLDSYLKEDRHSGFDLAKAPLMRLKLIRIADNTYHFIWSYHHILFDGWSVPILLNEVLSGYKAISEGQMPFLPLRRPYRDYIYWLSQQDLSQARVFWQQALASFNTPIHLSVDKKPDARPAQETVYAEQSLPFSQTATDALRSFARNYSLTLNTVFQGAWALLLGRYSGESDVLFGTTTSGRPVTLENVESMVGLFINTLPLRVRLEAQVPVVSWLKALQAQQAEARQYEFSPLIQIQEWSEVPRSSQLFESLLVFENFPVDTALKGLEELFLPVRQVHIVEQTNYPLTITIAPDENISLQMKYDTQRFEATTIKGMLNHFETLIEGIVNHPERRLPDLPFLTKDECKQMLLEWNATEVHYAADHCLHQLFEKQVEQTPDAVAIVANNDSLTYRELNKRANQLASYLQKLGVGPDVLVGICIERSVTLLLGILGILKAGGAYVPLDPTYPRERLIFMMEDSHFPVLLTQECFLSQWSEFDARILCLETLWAELAQENDNNLTNEATEQNLAYMIYTSGSTGKPKGVMVTHQGLTNYLLWCTEEYEVTKGQGAPLHSPIGFDLTVTSLFAPWLAGKEVVLLPDNRSIETFEDALHDNCKFSFIKLTPTHLELINQLTASEHLAKRTQALILGGEALQVEMLTPLRSYTSHIRLINEYGPTETVVGCCVYELQPDEEIEGSVPIGRPIANMQMYILDAHQQPVPVGVAGELYIGGAGIARGYLNQPALTAERFVPDPFSSQIGGRIYKTGDLARYRSDGIIEYLGRLDTQVKVRGFRIEPGEIEAVLMRHPSMQDALVVVREDTPGDKRLVGYVTSRQQYRFVHDELRQMVQGVLPMYMVPVAFVQLEHIPITPNGKLDRQVLPPPERLHLEITERSVEPQTEMERSIVSVWQEVLQLENVDLHHNFFDLGGHSLAVIRVRSKLCELLKREISLVDLFTYPTVSSLASYLSLQQHESLPVALATTQAQRRMEALQKQKRFRQK